MPNYESDVEAWMLYAFAIVAMVTLTLFGTNLVTTGPAAWTALTALCVSWAGAQMSMYNEEKRRRFRQNIWTNKLERYLFVTAFIFVMALVIVVIFVAYIITKAIRSEK